ncbi:hypothetical protein MA16_Dca019484 [Dendrobium catenatum]|uniref:Uncharacterized protein n=1 Tax=Dendrobium catenatum TaxID=906689 RepID=A0A2I0XJG2_9ASPA|nr:hypothetical protein MA16_Dca019484 [Dendrobium catenatum]
MPVWRCCIKSNRHWKAKRNKMKMYKKKNYRSVPSIVFLLLRQTTNRARACLWTAASSEDITTVPPSRAVALVEDFCGELPVANSSVVESFWKYRRAGCLESEREDGRTRECGREEFGE